MKATTNHLWNSCSELIQKNQPLSPTVEKIPLPKKQNRFQYVGGQILDGALYGIVNSAEHLLRYDLASKSIDFLGEFDSSDFKWSGGGSYEGRLYLFPRTKNYLLCYDPRTNEFEEIPCPYSYEKEHHYGGVLTADGILYQPPRNTDHLLRWDLREKTCRKIPLWEGVPCRYCGSVLHPNGSIYFVPEKNLPVLRLELATETITAVGEPQSALTFDPTVAPNGNVYGFCSAPSARGNGIFKIDVEANSVSILHPDIGFHSYGTKLGPNGKLYNLPGYTGELWEFDPTDESVRCYGTIDGEATPYYAGGSVDRNGDIYALPVYADHLLKISFFSEESQNLEIPEELYRSFFKDFY